MDQGTIRGQVVDSKVLITIQQDNSVIGFMSIVHIGQEYIIRQRRRPKNTSTNANIAQGPFVVQKPYPQVEIEYKHRKPLLILGMVDDYNHSMNGVDVVD